MRIIHVTAAAVLAVLGALAACSAGSNQDLLNPGRGGSGGKGGAPQAGTGGDTGESGTGGSGADIGLDVNIAPNDTGTIGGCQYADAVDHDGDGYSYKDGDCNDCDPNANPGAFDVVGGIDGGPGVDEDCNGKVDDEPADCDANLQIADDDPKNGARAIGLCRFSDPNASGKDKTWGVIAARYVKADGAPGMNPMSHGLVPQFGAANVQQGKTMLVLSSGVARAPGQPGFVSPNMADMKTSGGAPPGYPKESPACPGVKTGPCNDPAALELQIRVPTNAKSFRFNFNFYTYEFPIYICSTYNDFFVTMMDPKPSALPDGNISFDQDKNPVSVNNSLLQVCPGPKTVKGKLFKCPLGTALLAKTGFDELAELGPHAATGWLQTLAPLPVPAQPGLVITLRFAIWDSGDHILDSTVLVDNFQWLLEPASGSTTSPVPTPK
jgi:hypothetical protein